MRLKVLCAFVLLNCSAAMLGQANSGTTWDVFVGGSYNRVTNDPGQNLYGWDASVSERPYSSHRWLGGTVEGSGAYHNTTTGASGGAISTSYSLYTLMGGPVIAVPYGHVRPFAHALFGGAFQYASAATTGFSVSAHDKNYAFAGGGGVDLSISRTWAIRGQADYVRAAQTGTTALDVIRASAGIVGRF